MMSEMWFIPMIFCAMICMFFMFSRFRPGGMGFTEKEPYERNQPSSRIDSSAMEVLKMRYAKGEISKTEYDNLKRELID